MAVVDIDGAALDAFLERALIPTLTRRALNVEGSAKAAVARGGTGRLYTTRFFRRDGKLYSYGRRVPHRASRPGSAPASDTGRLLGSIGHDVGVDGDGPYAHIYARTNYAVYLELGTRYMAPRPFLRPALYALAGYDPHGGNAPFIDTSDETF